MEDYNISLPKASLAEMPTEIFPGLIAVIESAEGADKAVAYLTKHPLVGFDTETRPSFHKGQINVVALMQVATDDRAFLFRLNKTGITPSMKSFLENPVIVKVGLSLKDDFQMLRRREALDPKGFVELQKLVHDYHISDASLQKIYGIVFGKRISKGQRLTNWEAKSLTRPQQLYASLDAWACLQIYRELTSGRYEPATSPYRIEHASSTTSESHL